jgi:hypothetical protein
MGYRRAFIALPALLAIALAAILRGTSPETIERVYSRGIYPAIARVAGAVSDLVPFSIAEVWFWILLVATVFLLIRGIVRLVRRRLRWRAALRFWAFLVLVAAPALFVLFVALWGANYGRLPIERKTGHDEARLGRERFRTVLLSLARAASRTRPAETDSLARGTLQRTADAVDEVVRELEGRPVRCARRAKTLVVNGFFRLAGIHGITVPFTHEAHHRRDLLPVERPWIAAHERAHLAGYASEAEASFVGFAACVRARDPMACYSGYLGLLLEFMSAANEDEWKAVSPHLADDVRKDLRFVLTRRRNERSALHDVTRRLNDAYLKANRVAGGVKDYGRVVRLVLGADPSAWPLTP